MSELDDLLAANERYAASFHTIPDQASALRRDVERIRAWPYLKMMIARMMRMTSVPSPMYMWLLGVSSPVGPCGGTRPRCSGDATGAFVT